MSVLQQSIQQRRQVKPILSMLHVIYGYPTVEKSVELMRSVLDAGVDLLEVQFPFTDPVADGELITAACHEALSEKAQSSVTMQGMFAVLKSLQHDYPDTHFIVVSYLNPIFQYGMERFICHSAQCAQGLVIPDLPVDNTLSYQTLCQNYAIDPIWMVTPDTRDTRLKHIAQYTQGFVYCTARKGVTGAMTQSMSTLPDYLEKVRLHIKTPLAVGFGLSTSHQVRSLHGIADIAIVGSALLQQYQKRGLRGIKAFVSELYES